MIKSKSSFYDLLIYFNEKRVKTSYYSVTCCCPFHKDDSPSFSYNIESRYFHCFGCKVSGDIFKYVMHKLRQQGQPCTFKDSVRFVVDFFELDKDTLGLSDEAKVNYKKKLSALNKFDKVEFKPFTLFNEQDILAMVGARGDFFQDKGFTKETLDYFQVGFDQKEKRVVVPLRDEDGNLAGITGRTIHKDYKEREIPKWKHYINSNVRNVLFNVHNVIKDRNSNNGTAILCEGPSDVMNLFQKGFVNGIACLGNNLTQEKKGILLRNFITVYIFLDADEGGESGAKEIIKQLKGYFNLFKVTGPEGKDPADLTQEEIEIAINNAVKVV